MNPTKKPAPTATGSFEQKPLAHILVYLAGKHSGGTLEVTLADATTSVYFQDGKPAKIHCEGTSHELGPILSELGFVERSVVDDAYMRANEQNLLLGEVLIAEEKLETMELVRALKTQTFRRMVELFGQTTASFAFYDGVNLLRGKSTSELFPIEPGAVIIGGLRTYSDKLTLDSVLAGLNGRWVKIADIEPLKNWRLEEAERAICAVIVTSPQPFSALISGDRFDAGAAQRVLYTLTIFQNLSLFDAPPSSPPPATLNAPVTADSFTSTPPPNAVQAADELSDEVIKKRLDLEERGAAMASQNYFEMLGIEIGAPPDVARKAYFQMVKSYHPDKMGKLVGPEYRDMLQFIFSNITEAHSTLADPATHEAYLDHITKGTEEAEQEAEVAAVLEAENAFQKAVVLMRREQYPEALAYIQKAMLLQAEEGEYFGAEAYLRWKISPQEFSAKTAVDVLRRALEKNPKSRRLHMLIGITLKADGRRVEAREHFAGVLRSEPHNMEAAREIRMIEMLDKRDKEAKPLGILDRFFKKKD